MSFDVDVTVRRGETVVGAVFTSEAPVVALFGASGAGKTSVLHMVAGLLRPDHGHVRVAGETLFDGHTNLTPERRRAGYVFQDARLFPHLRVGANLRYGAAHDADLAAIDFLDIGHLHHRWPRTLSGGEARRVAIGRALLSNPRFLLLDEPTASLDRARREEILIAIERARDASRLPMLLVTHDRAEAERLAGHIVEL